MGDNKNCSINNIYRLDGRVPIAKAIPFGLQHILAMFVSNLAPITLIAGAAQPVAGTYGYPAVIGAVLIGGIFEGTMGLLAKYWRKIITPVVAASVVTSIGLSLFTVGARSFGGWLCGRLWIGAESDPGFFYAAGMSAVEYFCKRLFKTAVCINGADCGLYSCSLYG